MGIRQMSQEEVQVLIGLLELVSVFYHTRSKP
jgi:hypothetical protein